MAMCQQIGAYDQQIWEKSLEQTELNVRHPIAHHFSIQHLGCIQNIVSDHEKIYTFLPGNWQQAKEDWTHQTRPN